MIRSPTLTLAMTSGVVWPKMRIVPGPNGITRDRGNGQRQGQKRRQRIDETVRARGRHVLFEQELQAVGQRLQQSVRADAVGSHAALDVRRYFALEPDDVGQRGQQNEKQHHDLDQRDQEYRIPRKEFVHGCASASRRLWIMLQ